MLLADWIFLLHVHVDILRPKGQDEHMCIVNRHSLSHESRARLMSPECPMQGDSLRLYSQRMTARAPQSLIREHARVGQTVNSVNTECRPLTKSSCSLLVYKLNDLVI